MLILQTDNLIIDCNYQEKLANKSYRFYLLISIQVNWKLKRLTPKFKVKWKLPISDETHRKVDFDVDSVHTIYSMLSGMWYDIDWKDFTDNLESFLLYKLSRITD